MDLKQTLKTIKLYESTISMILGAIVIALAAFLVFSYFRNLKVGKTTDNAVQNEVSVKEVYKVQKGDTLWSIAENRYNNGFEWVKIAEANSLSESSQIEVGMELTIPQDDIKVAEIITPTETQTVSVTESSTQVTSPVATDTITSSAYTVTKGDSLWKIAVRAYGDGYKWVDIAKANKIVNPDVIYSGMNLTLPR